MKPRNAIPALVAMCALLLGACSASQGHIDASSRKALLASLETTGKGVPASMKPEWATARATFKAAYFTDNGSHRVGMPHWRAVDGMTPADFIRFNRQAVALPAPASSVEVVARTESLGYIAKDYIESVKLDIALLEQARNQAHRENLFTVDQFTYPEPAFIPPPNGVDANHDVATFAISLTNNSGFDAYDPVFQVTIADRATKEVIYHGTLKRDKKLLKDPVLPGGPTLLVFHCCNVVQSPGLNTMLRNLPQSASFHYELISLKDATLREAMDQLIFPSRDFLRLKREEVCLKQIQEEAGKKHPEQLAKTCSSYLMRDMGLTI